jgi:hypothetical protein
MLFAAYNLLQTAAGASVFFRQPTNTPTENKSEGAHTLLSLTHTLCAQMCLCCCCLLCFTRHRNNSHHSQGGRRRDFSTGARTSKKHEMTDARWHAFFCCVACTTSPAQFIHLKTNVTRIIRYTSLLRSGLVVVWGWAHKRVRKNNRSSIRGLAALATREYIRNFYISNIKQTTCKGGASKALAAVVARAVVQQAVLKNHHGRAPES